MRSKLEDLWNVAILASHQSETITQPITHLETHPWAGRTQAHVGIIHRGCIIHAQSSGCLLYKNHMLRIWAFPPNEMKIMVFIHFLQSKELRGNIPQEYHVSCRLVIFWDSLLGAVLLWLYLSTVVHLLFPLNTEWLTCGIHIYVITSWFLPSPFISPYNDW